MGELTRSEAMEKLMEAIFMNKVPDAWRKLSFETTRGLGSWLDNIKQRLEQLNMWKESPEKEPPITFLNKLYNQTEIQKKMYWEVADLQKRDGAFVFGFQVEGARWDPNSGLEESEPKKQFSVVPVVLCRAVLISDKEDKGIYQCPCYKTETRGKTYVFTAQLKTKHPPLKWCLAGVALLLDVEGISD